MEGWNPALRQQEGADCEEPETGNSNSLERERPISPEWTQGITWSSYPIQKTLMSTETKTDADIIARLTRIENKLDLLSVRLQHLELEVIMAYEAELTAAEAAATNEANAETAAENLLTTLSALITKLGTGSDPATAARITALGTALQTRADALASAVVANTPAAPAA